MPVTSGSSRTSRQSCSQHSKRRCTRGHYFGAAARLAQTLAAGLSTARLQVPGISTDAPPPGGTTLLHPALGSTPRPCQAAMAAGSIASSATDMAMAVARPASRMRIVRLSAVPDLSLARSPSDTQGTEPRWSALGRTTLLPTREGPGYVGNARLSPDRVTDSTPLEFPG